MLYISLHVNKKCRALMKTYTESHFNGCLLIWVLHSSKLNDKTNHIHEIVLGVLYTLIRNHFSIDNLIKMAPLQFIKIQIHWDTFSYPRLSNNVIPSSPTILGESWHSVPQNIEDCCPFICFNRHITKWKPDYPFHLCQFFFTTVWFQIIQ